MNVDHAAALVVRSELDEALVDLEAFGCGVIEGVLPPEVTARLRSSVLDRAAEDEARGDTWYSNGNQRVFMLLNRGVEFLELAEHPVADRVARHVLGEDYLLSSITANIARPGNVPQGLHADQQYVREPWPYPVTVQLVWMLDDFTLTNGSTRVVPGTHRLGVAPNTDDVSTTSVVGPAGSAVLVDGRLWHGAGQNNTDVPRIGILAYYCSPWLRQQENVFRSLDPKLRSSLTAAQRRLLGYDVWYGLGVVNGLPAAWMGRENRSGPVELPGEFATDGSVEVP